MSSTNPSDANLIQRRKALFAELKLKAGAKNVADLAKYLSKSTGTPVTSSELYNLASKLRSPSTAVASGIMKLAPDSDLQCLLAEPDMKAKENAEDLESWQRNFGRNWEITQQSRVEFSEEVTDIFSVLGKGDVYFLASYNLAPYEFKERLQLSQSIAKAIGRGAKFIYLTGKSKGIDAALFPPGKFRKEFESLKRLVAHLLKLKAAQFDGIKMYESLESCPFLVPGVKYAFFINEEKRIAFSTAGIEAQVGSKRYDHQIPLTNELANNFYEWFKRAANLESTENQLEYE